jgi:hypothetical protein
LAVTTLLNALSHAANSSSEAGHNSHTRLGVCNSIPRPLAGRLRLALTRTLATVDRSITLRALASLCPPKNASASSRSWK